VIVSSTETVPAKIDGTHEVRHQRLRASRTEDGCDSRSFGFTVVRRKFRVPTDLRRAADITTFLGDRARSSSVFRHLPDEAHSNAPSRTTFLRPRTPNSSDLPRPVSDPEGRLVRRATYIRRLAFVRRRVRSMRFNRRRRGRLFGSCIHSSAPTRCPRNPSGGPSGGRATRWAVWKDVRQGWMNLM
jgi:hypothetical protein